MTIDDAKYFIQQCHDIGWIPNEISIIGGEPTLHKDFDEFVELALEFVNGDKGDVVSVWSNICLLYTSPSPRDRQKSRMPSSA